MGLRIVAAGLFGSIVLAGCSGATSEVDAQSSDIIGGATDSTDASIVEFVQALPSGDEFTCTATFVSQRTLLTAAHCLVAEGSSHVIPQNAKFSIVMSTNANSGKNVIQVPRANVHPHPGYDGDAKHDIAVVVLPSKVAGVVPVAFNKKPLTQAMVGSTIRLVGYGQAKRTSGTNDGSGVRRTVTTTLRGLQGDLALIGTTGKQACDGDSGGPALMKVDGVETIIGTDDLASSDVDCTGGDLYQRPDLHASFIDPYL